MENKSEKLKLVFDFIADYLNEDNKVVRTNEKVNNVINGKKSFDEIRLINKLNEIKTRHGKPNTNKEIGLTYDEFGNIQTVVSEDEVKEGDIIPKPMTSPLQKTKKVTN